MPILPPPSRVTHAETLSELVKPEYHHEAKLALERLASVGDIEVLGSLVELSPPERQLDGEVRPLQYPESIIVPANLSVADWDWFKSRLSFDTVSRALPEPQNLWYANVSFLRDEISKLLGASYREIKPVQSNKPGPKENSKWNELLIIANDLSFSSDCKSAEDFYDTIRDRAEEGGIWASRSNTSFKVRPKFVELARQSLTSSD